MGISEQRAGAPGSLARAARRLELQLQKLKVLKAQRRSLPRDDAIAPLALWRIDRDVKQTEQERAAAQAVWLDTFSTAVACIQAIERERFPTAEASMRRYQELVSLPEEELDRLWMAADLVLGYVALGYPREPVVPPPVEEAPRAMPTTAPQIESKAVALYRERVGVSIVRLREANHAQPSLPEVARDIGDTRQVLRYRLEHWTGLIDLAWHWPPAEAILVKIREGRVRRRSRPAPQHAKERPNHHVGAEHQP